jgi:hypothetical protein
MKYTRSKVFLAIVVCCTMIFSQVLQGQDRSSKQYDLIIVGGTPGGIMAAIAAARLGKKSLILERTAHIGGLPANGLGATDLATRGATTGLFTDFVGRVKAHYVKKYGANSAQVKASQEGYHFEPSVAEHVFEQMLAEQRQHVEVRKLMQFDAAPTNISISGRSITMIKVLNRKTKLLEEFKGKVFLDATYEGDLGAAAGIPFVIGREGKDEYNEPGAGQVYKYWRGPESEESSFQRDNAVQSYNYRLCLTNDSANSLRIEKPGSYNRQEYVSLVEDVLTGRHTGASMLEVTEAMLEKNRAHVLKGGKTEIPGDVWGIAKITNMVSLPNKKTDANNQHMAFISTDLPEENWPWPTSGWDWRDTFAQRLKEYTLGLIYFAQNDPELPAHFRNAALEWGLAKDEYQDNANFPRQVYVREGRRFQGMYFFTAKDALPVTTGARPPIHPSSITASHYALDSHAVRKREQGKIHLDGFLSYPSAVYTVPLGVMVPKQIDNLLLPVPVSGSHIGFSTLRMEPCWMAIGQAAGVAAALALEGNAVKVQEVKQSKLQEELIAQDATLIYYKDVNPSNPDFRMVQYMGLRGYLPNWEASLNTAASADDLELWAKLSNNNSLKAGKKTARGTLLKEIYSSLQSKTNL